MGQGQIFYNTKIFSYMMQNHISLVELNRRYYRFDDSEVNEKKLRFSRGLTEYNPSICQLVNKKNLFSGHARNGQ